MNEDTIELILHNSRFWTIYFENVLNVAVIQMNQTLLQKSSPCIVAHIHRNHSNYPAGAPEKREEKKCVFSIDNRHATLLLRSVA